MLEFPKARVKANFYFNGVPLLLGLILSRLFARNYLKANFGGKFRS